MVLVAFVRQLVETVAHLRESQARIAEIPGVSEPAPSADSARVIAAARAMLDARDIKEMIAAATRVHDLSHELNPDDRRETDHIIDMLSSCASAIRFGFETPCHSRHAASAAGHIWRKLYGIRLEDSHTPNWQKDWARIQLQDAILNIASYAWRPTETSTQ